MASNFIDMDFIWATNLYVQFIFHISLISFASYNHILYAGLHQNSVTDCRHIAVLCPMLPKFLSGLHRHAPYIPVIEPQS